MRWWNLATEAVQNNGGCQHRVALRTAVAVAAMGAWMTMNAATDAQEINYDESKVPEYVLPDPLTLEDGTPVSSAEAWRALRRPEVFRLFEEHVYGRAPQRPGVLHYVVFEESDNALGGAATRRQVSIALTDEAEGQTMDLLLYLPNGAPHPVPVFVGLNFYGNQTIHDDPAIRLPASWLRNNPDFHITEHRATEESRGVRASRWPVEQILARGYGVATIYYGDIEPDDPGQFEQSVRRHYLAPGQDQPGPDEWGAIGAWAWGLSRAMDYFHTDPDVDQGRVAVLGHSRLGKTSLWAGATDERFAIVVSNNSGCGGAALSRRRYGETVERINTRFPHWFCGNFAQYNDHEDDLPVDQHMLIALAAPRPAYVASAEDDRWADPRGEFLAALNASPVYRLLGAEGLPVSEMPLVDQPVLGTIGYHIRSGGHDITEFDWQRYMDFADMHYGRQGG